LNAIVVAFFVGLIIVLGARAIWGLMKAVKGTPDVLRARGAPTPEAPRMSAGMLARGVLAAAAFAVVGFTGVVLTGELVFLVFVVAGIAMVALLLTMRHEGR
jgi:hypothetical protein